MLYQPPACPHQPLLQAGQRLPPLVKYERHRGVILSVAGKRRALEVLRHHRLLETFLFEVLYYPIEEVHEEAERLEHFISERFEGRIEAKLGYPKVDPLKDFSRLGRMSRLPKATRCSDVGTHCESSPKCSVDSHSSG